MAQIYLYDLSKPNLYRALEKMFAELSFNFDYQFLTSINKSADAGNSTSGTSLLINILTAFLHIYVLSVGHFYCNDLNKYYCN